MRKFALIISVFLLMSFKLNTVYTIAKTEETFSEGIYTLTDLKLMANVPYKVRNVSGGKAFIGIFNDDLVLEQSIRFEPTSLQYVLNPMDYNYKIVIIGTGQLSFA